MLSASGRYPKETDKNSQQISRLRNANYRTDYCFSLSFRVDFYFNEHRVPRDEWKGGTVDKAERGDQQRVAKLG